MPESRLRESKVFTGEISDTGKELLLQHNSINFVASLLYWKLGHLAVVQTMTQTIKESRKFSDKHMKKGNK